MLRRTIAKSLSAFGVFMKDNKDSAALKGLSIPLRGKKLGNLFAALSDGEKAALKARGALVPAVKTKKTKSPTVLRVPSKYNLFVKAQLKNAQGPMKERMKKVAEMWKSRQ